MKLEKLLWSNTKADILKYLVFKRQGISIRALENDLPWSFPAIKKQIDSLLDSQVIEIDKTQNKRSISLEDNFWRLIKEMLLYGLKSEITKYCNNYEFCIKELFLWKIFGKSLEIDLVVIYQGLDTHSLQKIKEDIWEIFKNYFIDAVGAVFMENDDFQKRYRLADKFVLTVMRAQ